MSRGLGRAAWLLLEAQYKKHGPLERRLLSTLEGS